jgi:3-phenylpropionate/trans-cinnamate dioxygenase ferredoxin subunit
MDFKSGAKNRRLSMKYVKAIQADELSNGQKMKVTIEDKEILLVNLDNDYYAVDSVCPHMGGALNEGKLEAGHIICPRHGSVFDVKTGKVVERGTLFMIKVKVGDLKSYPVKREGEDVLIGIE